MRLENGGVAGLVWQPRRIPAEVEAATAREVADMKALIEGRPVSLLAKVVAVAAISIVIAPVTAFCHSRVGRCSPLGRSRRSKAGPSGRRAAVTSVATTAYHMVATFTTGLTVARRREGRREKQARAAATGRKVTERKAPTAKEVLTAKRVRRLMRGRGRHRGRLQGRSC